MTTRPLEDTIAEAGRVAEAADSEKLGVDRELVRARAGDRMPWYELPEEVRSPYLAE